MRAAPAVSCARLHKEKRTRAYRFSGGSPAFPAQWLYGLCRAAPRRRILFVTVASGLKTCPSPVGPTRISAGLTSATDARTTRFCRTQQTPFVLRAVYRSRVRSRPAITLRARRRRVHRIPSRVRDDPRSAPLAGWTAQAGRTDLPDGESETFFKEGLDRFL